MVPGEKGIWTFDSDIYLTITISIPFVDSPLIRNPTKPCNAVVPLKISYYKFSTNLPSSSTRTSSDYIFCHNIGGVRYTDFTLQSIPFYDIKIVQAVKLKPRWAGLVYLAEVKLCFREMAKLRGLDNIEQL